ncbi:cornichon protein-domain-containing protein [Endogone sp. FLAS-F59071]|nr:cornichon protein-domain-containing protein [Endogone sp. FLAS-F59071]|eukprot:RUS23355.1 cornichon protein-domain-containing protein [Endogone sp. FLAS-F59071]
MPGEGLLFLFGVIMAALLLFIMVFFVIMFSDLECDYINPIDLCNKLNQVRVEQADQNGGYNRVLGDVCSSWPIVRESSHKYLLNIHFMGH